MKKIHMIAALLAMLMPAVVFGGGTAIYYAKLTTGLTSSSPTGSGTVYLGNAEAGSSSTYSVNTRSETYSASESYTSNSKPSSLNVTFYLSAKANYGYKFSGWYGNAAGTGTAKSSNAEYSLSVSASGSENSPTDGGGCYAKFEQNTDDYAVSLIAPEGLSSYSVTGPTGFNGSGLSNGGEFTAYKGDSFTFSATVATGYEFVKWTVNGADAGTSTTLTKTFSSASTVQAVVNKLVTYYATCQAVPAGCSYKVGSTTVSSSEYQISGYGTLTVNLSAPTAASGYMFAGWYEIVDGNKTIISTDASTSVTKKSDVMLGADFVAITAPVMLVTSFGIVDYDDFDAAFAAAKSGDKLKVVASGALAADAYVNPGVMLDVAAGVTLTVTSGATLYIDGSATVNGTISGTVSKCTKLIQQTGDGTVNAETGKPNPFIPYDGVKYWRTTTTTPSISVSSSASHITVVNGYGNVFRTSATTAKALVCTADMSTAVNHIMSIDTDYTSFTLAYESARQSATAGSGTSQSIKGNSKLIVMLANDTSASESGEQRYGFMVDCAGCNLAFSATLKSNYDVVILNCPYTAGNQLKSTITNTRVHFFNCKKAGVKINSKNSTIVNCYDCGDLSISYDPSTVQSGEVNIYSGGPYSASFNKLWHIYGGTFKSKPSTDYLWDSTNYEIQPEGSNWKVVEKKPTVYVAYTVTGTTTTEYESLSEAIGAVVNGGTVFLMQDIELEADLQIGAGREVTIEMTGCDISGHNIVNAGILHLEDRKMTSNPGTVSSGIVNNGTITIAYGEYAGSIQLNAGMFTVYNGTVDGSITVASSVEDPATVANLKGGQFASHSFTHGSETKDISTICEAVESEHVVRAKNGRFRVARFPAAIVTDTGTMSLSAVALGSDDSSLWTRFASAPTRANFTAAEWYRVCELQSTFEYYQTQGIDCAVLVDRTVTAGTLSVSAPVVGTQSIDAEILVSEFGYSALLPIIRDFPHTPQYAPWAYSTFLPGGEHSSVSFALTNGNSANNGTLLIVQMRLASDIQSSSGKKDYSYTQYDVIGSRKYVLNAGSNKAMIRPASGAATFYATLGAAMDAVADGGTVMLANDCDAALALNKAGTYTFDTMGFAYSGGEPVVGSGLKIASVTTNAVESSAKVLVPDAMTITYVVENAGTIECGETKYVSIEAAVEASSGDTIAVTVTADDTETVTLPQGKTLTVTVNDGVTANVTVEVPEGSFLETATEGTTTTYESKQITVKMEKPSAVEVVKVDHGVTNEVSDASLVNEAVHALTGNHDVSRTDNTDKLDVLDKITVTPTKIVEEVVGADTIIRSVTFDVVPHLHAGQSLAEGQTLKFRLPVAAEATQLASIVYHGDAQFGIYPVQTYDNEKFIEVESADFSPYSYELLDGETANPIAAIGTTGYATLAAAVAAAQNGDTVTLLADVDLGTTGLVIAADKNFTLDIGAFDISGTVNGKLITNNGTVTIEGTTGCVYNQDISAQGHDAFLNNGTATVNGGWFGDADNDKTNANGINRGAAFRNFGTATINGGHFTACDNYTNGGYAYAIINGDEDEGPTLTINDADVYGRNNGNIANNCGTVTVNGGVYDLTGASSYQSVYSYCGSTVVTKGTFTKSGNANAQFRVEIDSDNADNPGIIAVSGGSFTQIVPEQYCAEGFIPGEQDPETGLYTVKPGTYVAQVMHDGAISAKYESLYGAVGAASAGDTVVLLADIGESLTIRKSLTLTGDYKITGTTKVTDGAAVAMEGLTLDANCMIYALDIAGGASVAMTNVTVGGGQWCNVHLNGGSLEGSGVTMLGDEVVVAADGQTYTYRGETHDASEAPFGMDLSKVTGETVTLPFMDIVRENGDETVSLSDAQNKPLTQAGSILYLANMPGNDTLDGVTLPERFYSYTLTIEADIGFLGDGTTPTTGWAAGDWNEIIDTGTLVLDAIGEDSEEVPVLLTLNDDTDLGEEPFEFRYGNLTVDGDGNVLSGTIVYTDNAGVVSNAVLGTADTPLVIDLTHVTDIASLGDGIVVENVVLLVAESHAADGTEIFAWDPEAGEPSVDQSGRLSVVIVDENGSPTGDAATLTFDMEAGVAYLGTCVARLTGPTHDKPIYSSLAGTIAAAAIEGDTVTLLADIADYAGTTLINKSLTINGAGHSITAAAVPEGEHRDMIHAFTGGTSMLKIGGGAVTVTNITFNGHATHAYTYLIEVVNSGASLTVGDISLLNGGELDNSGTPGAGYGAGIHVNNASLVVKDGFYACTGGAEDGVFPFTGILPEGNASVMFDLVEDSDATPTVDIADDLLLVGMIGAIEPDTAQAILDYMQVPSRFIPYTLTLGDGSDYAFTGASPRTWNDIIDYGKEIMDVSTSLGYEGLDKESTPVEVGLLTNTELPGTFVFEDANFSVNGNGNELTGTIKYTASAGELKNVVLTSDTILDISAQGAAVKFGDNVTIKAGEAVTLVVGELSSGQTLATHVDGLSLDSVVLKTWDGDNLVDAVIPEGLVLIEVDGNLVVSAAVVQVVTDNGMTTNMYATLEEAFTAANAAGTAAITILDDYTLVGNIGVTVNAGSNITLDLNGHTVSNIAPDAAYGYMILNNGTLTIKDSTDILKNGTGNGRMTARALHPDTKDSPEYATNLIENHGTLNIESGLYEETTTAGYASYVVDNHSGGTANISGGKLTNIAPYTYVVRMFLNSTTSENALNISGTAEISGTYGVWLQYANRNANKASLNVSGGTISSSTGYAVYAGGGYRDASNIDVSFTGGTVNGSGVWLGSDTAFKSLEVTGGTYAAFGASSSNNGFISGGTYKSTGLFNQGGRTDPYSVLADGYILTDLGNGTYGVVAGSYVAQIVSGTTTNKYASLEAAIAVVPTDGTETTITMITNSVETAVITVASGKNIVLDLNGKTVSYTTDAKSVYFITNKGALTIEDNSANADGQILLTAQPDTGYSVENVTIYNENGTLTLLSGTIKNATAGGLAYAVNNSSNAWGSDVVSTFNMEGGTVSAPSGDAALRVYQNCSSHVSPVSKNYVNITGGTILDTGIFVDTVLYTDNGIQEGFADSIDTQINISGGTINGLIDMKIRHKNNTKLNITGGDFTNAKLWVRKYTGEYKGDEPTEPMVYISGGKFAFITGKAFGLSYDCGATSWTSYEKPYAVSGGVFNVEVPEAFCAEGYIPAENTDAETAAAYPYTVMVAPNYVAQIVTGTTTNKYASLAEAFETAQSGDTIQMTADSAETTCSTLAAGKNVVLDLNGKTVSLANASTLITNNGTLTIQDSSENETGLLLLTSGVGAQSMTVYNQGGTLTLASGTIRNTSGGLAYAVNNAVNHGHVSTFNMAGGTISAPNGDADLRVYNNTAFNVTADCKNYVNITGGTIADNGIFIDTYLGGTYSESFTGDNLANEINISGGTINGLIDMKIRHPFNTSLNITGGDFTNTKLWVRKYSEYNASLAEPTEPMVYISGGKFAFVTGKAFGLSYDCGATSWTSYEKPYAVSGGVFNVEVPEAFCAEGYAPADNTNAETAAAYPYTVVSAAPTYEITWVSEGEILAVDVVTSNTVPVYAGETPVKDPDDNGIYTFKGWKPKLEAAVSNTTYTATFSNSCTIRWMTGDTVVKSVSVTNGTPAAEIAALAPIGANSSEGNARFAGWAPAYADALGDADYFAQFTALDFLDGIVPGTLHFTSIKANGRKVAVTFEFKPTGGKADAYRLIYKTAIDSAETLVSDIANVTLVSGDENTCTSIAEVTLPEACESKAFITGLDFVEVEQGN